GRAQTGEEVRDRGETEDHRRPRSLDEEVLQSGEPVLHEEVPDRARDVEDERAGVLHVVEDALDAREQPTLEGVAAPGATGAERIAETRREADSGNARERVQLEPATLALGEMGRRRLGGVRYRHR